MQAAWLIMAVLLGLAAGNNIPEHEQMPPDSIPTPIKPPPWLVPWIPHTNAIYPHNDLPALLKAVNTTGTNWVTVFVYNLGVRDFFLNCLFSYLKYGQGKQYIVAVVGAPALHDCLEMKLPCYNASKEFAVVSSSVGGGGYELDMGAGGSFHNFGSMGHVHLCWTKVKLGYHILALGYHLHISDVDIVYMRRIEPSLNNIFGQGDVDITMLWEEGAPPGENQGYINMVNTGAVFAVSNNRTKALYRAWALAASQGGNDQDVFNRNIQSWTGMCETHATCLSVKRTGRAALTRHPSLFVNGNSCYMPFNFEACDNRRLYIHVLCSAGRNWKTWAFRKVGLWFMADRSGNELNQSALHINTLPCAPPNDVAWNRPVWSYHAITN